MTIEHVWHFYGESAVPERFRNLPFELHDGDLVELSRTFDVMIYRDGGPRPLDSKTRLVLALDERGKRFHSR